MAIGSGKVYFDDSTAFQSGSLGKLFVDEGGEAAVMDGGYLIIEDGGEATVESGGTIDVESGGGIDIESGADIDVESGGHIDLASGGYIDVASGGYISVASGGSIRYPVVGCTSSYKAGSGTSSGAVLPNNGIVFALMTGSESVRHLDITTPVAGVNLKIFLSHDIGTSSGGTSSGSAITFDSGTGATIDSTNRYFYFGSSNSTYNAGSEKYVELVGISTSRWVIKDYRPGTWGTSGWLVGTTA